MFWMEIQLNQSLLEKLPKIKVGINHYTKITVDTSPQMLKGRLQLFQEQIHFDLLDRAVTDVPGIAEWREIWKTLGANPSRYRHSAEALLRRIAKQNYIQPVHSAVDLNTFFSLQYEIPVGIYDINTIHGNCEVNIGNKDTTYDGLNGRTNTLENIIVLRDEETAFGSPYVDSKRTAVTPDTIEAIQVFFLKPSMEEQEAFELLEAAGKMFTTLSGGYHKTYLLHREQKIIHLQ